LILSFVAKLTLAVFSEEGRLAGFALVNTRRGWKKIIFLAVLVER